MGRQRKFDVDEALDQAMVVFWRKGFSATTISDLTAAMGIGRPSLYAAFSSKEKLFERVLERYLEGPSGYLADALAEPRADRAAEAVLRGAAGLHTAPDSPAGCLIVATTTGEQGSVDAMVLAARADGELMIRDRMARAVEESDLPPDTDPAALARYLRAVMFGMAVLATSGASRAELDDVVTTALGCLPARSAAGQIAPPPH